MEYASLCWMSASPTTLQLLDRIQNKALRIIGVNSDETRTNLNKALSPPQTLCCSCYCPLCNAHQSLPCWPKMPAPPPFLIRRLTRASISAKSCSWRTQVKNSLNWQKLPTYTADLKNAHFYPVLPTLFLRCFRSLYAFPDVCLCEMDNNNNIDWPTMRYQRFGLGNIWFQIHAMLTVHNYIFLNFNVIFCLNMKS